MFKNFITNINPEKAAKVTTAFATNALLWMGSKSPVKANSDNQNPPTEKTQETAYTPTKLNF